MINNVRFRKYRNGLRLIINERLNGKKISRISSGFRNFELLVYPGDVLSFLNGVVHELEGIQRIARATKREDVEKKIGILIDKIEVPKRKSVT